MTTLATPRPATELAVRRRVGRAYLAAAGTFVLYIALIVTTSTGYEEDLTAAAEEVDVAVNRLPAETLAQIGQDHPLSNLANLVLLLLPITLLVATRRAAAVTGDRWGVRLAVGGAAIWVSYLLLNLGLLADPGSLPPLTRDLDVLTVPTIRAVEVLPLVPVIVTLGSTVSVAAFVVSAWALRRHGWRPVASGVAAGLAVVLLALSAVTLVTSGFDEPIPPIVLFPAELVLAIALLVGRARS